MTLDDKTNRRLDRLSYVCLAVFIGCVWYILVVDSFVPTHEPKILTHEPKILTMNDCVLGVDKFHNTCLHVCSSDMMNIPGCVSPQEAQKIQSVSLTPEQEMNLISNQVPPKDTSTEILAKLDKMIQIENDSLYAKAREICKEYAVNNNGSYGIFNLNDTFEQCVNGWTK